MNYKIIGQCNLCKGQVVELPLTFESNPITICGGCGARKKIPIIEMDADTVGLYNVKLECWTSINGKEIARHAINLNKRS